ncbi:hypothetical protein HYW20_07065 [Candidatus Woesearchaeota archaeon]|nr:hypothetical protein [Candidatus Woesearchaeota archaeon]
MDKKILVGICILVLVNILSLSAQIAEPGVTTTVMPTEELTFGRDGIKLSFNNNNLNINNKEIDFLIMDGSKLVDESKAYINSESSKNENKLMNINEYQQRNFIITQQIDIFEEYIKTNHKIENKGKETGELTYYYVFKLNPNETVEFNGIRYSSDGNELYESANITNTININAEFDFTYQDLIDNGFELADTRFVSNNFFLGFKRIENRKLNEGEILELDPTVTIANLETIRMTPIDNTTYVLAWCDEVTDDVEFIVRYTNHTNQTSKISVDSNVGNCLYNYGLSIATINKSAFIIAYSDDAEDDFTIAVYNTSGSTLLAPLDIVTDAAGLVTSSISIAMFNSSHYVALMYNNSARDELFFTIGDVNGNININKQVIDNNVRNSAGVITVDTFNSSAFVAVWTDSFLQTFATLRSDGTTITPTTTYQNSTINPSFIDVVALNSTNFVALGVGGGNGNISWSHYIIDGVLKQKDRFKISSGSNIGGQLAKVNDTHFVAFITNGTSTKKEHVNLSVSLVNARDGNYVIANSTYNNPGAIWMNLDIISSQNVGNFGLCPNHIMIVKANHSSVLQSVNVSVEGFYLNATSKSINIWDGNCPPPPTNEQEGDDAILSGINNSEIWPATVYDSYQVGGANLTQQFRGRFDKFAIKGNKRWAINYVSQGESAITGIFNITPTLYVIQLQDLSVSSITQQVGSFINSTYP